MQSIAAKNARVGSEMFGETRFTDMTDEEFAAIYLTLKVEKETNMPMMTFEGVNATPIDWRSRGAVTEVKN
jgi:hypothetical protein